MMKHCISTLIGIAALLAPVAHAGFSQYNAWDEDYTVQALLGAVKFDNMKFHIDDSETPARADLSTLPQLGGAWTTLPRGNRFQYGMETSFLIAFRADKINYLHAGGDGLQVSLSTSLWLFDLAGGPYVSLFLDPGKKVRLYAGGGPLMMYATQRRDKEFSDDSDDEVTRHSDFGVGVYARAGLEFRTQERGMFGLGARGTWSNIDFSHVGGRSELIGTAIFATYTAGF